MGDYERLRNDPQGRKLLEGFSQLAKQSPLGFRIHPDDYAEIIDASTQEVLDRVGLKLYPDPEMPRGVPLAVDEAWLREHDVHP